MNKKFYNIFKYLFLMVMIFLVLFPIFMILNSSFKSTSELYQSQFSLVKKPIIENYKTAWIDGNIVNYAKNSIFVTVVSVFFIVLLSSMAAFALTRRETFKKFDKLIYIFFLIGIIIPPQVAIMPLYLQMNWMHLVDSLIGLSIIFIAYGIPFGVFIMYMYFRTIPKELEEAARIDGCSNFGIYSRIVMPLSKSSIVTVIIFSSVWIWNNFIFPLVFIISGSKKTLPIGLLAFKGLFTSNYPIMFAGIIIISLPLVVVYFLLQNQFMKGMLSGSIKG